MTEPNPTNPAAAPPAIAPPTVNVPAPNSTDSNPPPDVEELPENIFATIEKKKTPLDYITHPGRALSTWIPLETGIRAKYFLDKLGFWDKLGKNSEPAREFFNRGVKGPLGMTEPLGSFKYRIRYEEPLERKGFLKRQIGKVTGSGDFKTRVSPWMYVTIKLTPPEPVILEEPTTFSFAEYEQQHGVTNPETYAGTHAPNNDEKWANIIKFKDPNENGTVLFYELEIGYDEIRWACEHPNAQEIKSFRFANTNDSREGFEKNGEMTHLYHFAPIFWKEYIYRVRAIAVNGKYSEWSQPVHVISGLKGEGDIMEMIVDPPEVPILKYDDFRPLIGTPIQNWQEHCALVVLRRRLPAQAFQEFFYDRVRANNLQITIGLVGYGKLNTLYPSTGTPNWDENDTHISWNQPRASLNVPPGPPGSLVRPRHTQSRSEWFDRSLVARFLVLSNRAGTTRIHAQIRRETIQQLGRELLSGTNMQSEFFEKGQSIINQVEAQVTFVKKAEEIKPKPKIEGRVIPVGFRINFDGQVLQFNTKAEYETALNTHGDRLADAIMAERKNDPIYAEVPKVYLKASGQPDQSIDADNPGFFGFDNRLVFAVNYTNSAGTSTVLPDIPHKSASKQSFPRDIILTEKNPERKNVIIIVDQKGTPADKQPILVIPYQNHNERFNPNQAPFDKSNNPPRVQTPITENYELGFKIQSEVNGESKINSGQFSMYAFITEAISNHYQTPTPPPPINAILTTVQGQLKNEKNILVNFSTVSRLTSVDKDSSFSCSIKNPDILERNKKYRLYLLLLTQTPTQYQVSTNLYIYDFNYITFEIGDSTIDFTEINRLDNEVKQIITQEQNFGPRLIQVFNNFMVYLNQLDPKRTFEIKIKETELYNKIHAELEQSFKKHLEELANKEKELKKILDKLNGEFLKKTKKIPNISKILNNEFLPLYTSFLTLKNDIKKLNIAFNKLLIDLKNDSSNKDSELNLEDAKVQVQTIIDTITKTNTDLINIHQEIEKFKTKLEGLGIKIPKK